MFRVDDDVYAIADRCSHAEASLAEGEVFDGPRSNAPATAPAFDITDGCSADIAGHEAGRHLPDRAIVDGEVLITIPTEATA